MVHVADGCDIRNLADRVDGLRSPARGDPTTTGDVARRSAFGQHDVGLDGNLVEIDRHDRVGVAQYQRDDPAA